MFEHHDYYSKPLPPELRAGLPSFEHAVYSRTEAGSRLMALCQSERDAQHVEAALKLFERYARGETHTKGE